MLAEEGGERGKKKKKRREVSNLMGVG